MISLQVQNNQQFRIDEIPYLNKNDFIDSVSDGLSNGFRMIGLFPVDKNLPHKIISLLVDPDSSLINVPTGTSKIRSLPRAPFLLFRPPACPSLALKSFL